MNVAIVNPIAATANVTPHSVLRPEVPLVGADIRALRETNLVEMATELARRGLHPTVLFGDVFLDGMSWTSPEGVRIEPVDTLLRFPFHPGLVPATPGLMRHPALRDADVIQAGEFHQPSTFFATLAAREVSAPMVIWQETFRPMRFPGSAYQRAFESTLGRCIRARVVRFIPRTTRARGYLRTLGVTEASIGPWIPTGIDADAFVPRKSRLSRRDFGWLEDDPVILTVARLHPLKGVDLALRVLAWLRRRHPTARLLVRGSGPEEAALSRLARDLRVEDSVRFLGRVSREEMVDLYNLADVALCTSRADLMPFSLIEASSCGRPCVATDVGAIRDIVVDGETGIVPSAIDVGTVGMAVSALLQDEPRRLQMGSAARSRVESLFSLPVVADRFVRVYHDVAG